MKLRPFLLFLLFVALASCWLLSPKQTFFHSSKNDHQDALTKNLQQQHSGFSSVISRALSKTPQQQLTPLPYPAAPLESVSEKEALDFPGACVVEFAELEGPRPHQKLRLRILKTHLRNPYVRTEEVIDTKSGNLLGRLEMVANQLLVALSPGKDPQQFLKEFGNQALFITSISETLPLYRLTLRDASLASLPGALAQMQEGSSSNSSGEPNYIGHLSNRPENYGYGYQWGLWKNSDHGFNLKFRTRYEHYFYKWSHGQLDFFDDSDDSLKQKLFQPLQEESNNPETSGNDQQDAFSTERGINAEEAWDVRTSASSVIVAIIDSGIRYTHANLKNNIWQNPNPNPKYNDIHGYNAAEDNNMISDDVGHGTHCAGIIGGVANDDHLGVSGVAWQVQLMACKCSDKEGVMAEDSVIHAIDYAKQHEAAILNCSLAWVGAGSSIVMAVELQSLHDNGIILVASAGNDGTDNDTSLFKAYPASYSVQLDNIVSVAATDYLEFNPDKEDAPREREGLASFSNYGETTVSLAAPGTFILSTYNASDTSYVFMSGTSMAAPFVTGALALMKAEFPTASYQELINHLIETTDPLPSLYGKMIGGRLNLARALKTAPTPMTTSPASPSFPNQAASFSLNKEWKFLTGPCKRNDWISNLAK